MDEFLESVRRVICSDEPFNLLESTVEKLVLDINQRTDSYRDMSSHDSGVQEFGENGLILSPTDAGRCAEGYKRTLLYWRALHEAIHDCLELSQKRPVRVLYPGTGPYGMLALPIMGLFSADDVQFVLLDIHQESINSVVSLKSQLGVANRVESCKAMNLMDYVPDDNKTPDIIVMELLLAGLQSEGQVTYSRYLMERAPDAILIPEEIRLDLAWVRPEIEFSTTVSQQDKAESRVMLGAAFKVNREKIQQWKDVTGDYLPTETLDLPDEPPKQHELMLFTEMGLYKDHALRAYDNGLTAPIMFSAYDTRKHKNSLSVAYCVGARPGLELVN